MIGECLDVPARLYYHTDQPLTICPSRTASLAKSLALTQHVNADNGPPLIYIYIYIHTHTLLTHIHTYCYHALLC